MNIFNDILKFGSQSKFKFMESILATGFRHRYYPLSPIMLVVCPLYIGLIYFCV